MIDDTEKIAAIVRGTRFNDTRHFVGQRLLYVTNGEAEFLAPLGVQKYHLGTVVKSGRYLRVSWEGIPTLDSFGENSRYSEFFIAVDENEPVDQNTHE